MNRLEALKESLEKIEMGRTAGHNIIACPMCVFKQCTYQEWCQEWCLNYRDSAFCVKVFRQLAEEKKKDYWQVVKEHIAKQIRLLENRRLQK
jgi:hypothetical protein